MGETPDQERGTVRLDMDQMYREAVKLVGETKAAALWSDHNLDSGENWPGRWAKAMEIVQGLRAASTAEE